jgi:signal transduction histidine kinase
MMVSILSRQITKPIRELSRMADSLGDGHFQPSRIPIKDRELADLADVMNQTASRLAAYDRDQKTFFQNVSHELRTPLMSIQGYAEAIRYDVVPDIKAAAAVIMAESDRLTGMVEDLLFLSRVDSQQKPDHNDVFDPEDLLRDCQERLRGYAVKEQKIIDLSLGFDSVLPSGAKVLQVSVTPSEAQAPQVSMSPSDAQAPAVLWMPADAATRPDPVRPVLLLSGDYAALSRALDNVVANGVRYAVHRVLIQGCWLDHHYQITISDDGPGISPDVQPFLFDRFFKGEAGRYGIGLSISKTIIEQHLGHIQAGNGPEGGAQFVIDLPKIC